MLEVDKQEHKVVDLVALDMEASSLDVDVVEYNPVEQVDWQLEADHCEAVAAADSKVNSC